MAGARTFDHDEAKRLLAQGLKHREVAAIMGVSCGAIEWIDPKIMKNYARVHYRFPRDLKYALERCARAEGRSVNSQIIHIIKEYLDWQFYEENDPLEVIFAHPVAKHIKRVA